MGEEGSDAIRNSAERISFYSESCIRPPSTVVNHTGWTNIAVGTGGFQAHVQAVIKTQAHAINVIKAQNKTLRHGCNPL